MHVSRQVRREFRNDGAHTHERLGKVEMTLAGCQFDVTLMGLHAIQVRCKHSFYSRYGALDLEVLRLLAYDGEARGLQ